MEIVLKYRSKRQELAKWYWQMWRTKLWKTHLRIFVLVSLLSFIITYYFSELNINTIIIALVSGLSIIILLFLLPQIMFKSEMRTLIANESGIKTIIGTISGNIAWTEILSIEDAKESIIITGKTLNSFIIPNRAFNTSSERLSFLSSINKWLASTR